MAAFLFMEMIIFALLIHLIMYTLRTINEVGETNQEIGNFYQVISKHFHRESFNELFKDDPNYEVKSKILGVLVTNDSRIFLYEGEHYYILNEKGQTFSKPVLK